MDCTTNYNYIKSIESPHHVRYREEEICRDEAAATVGEQPEFEVGIRWDTAQFHSKLFMTEDDELGISPLSLISKNKVHYILIILNNRKGISAVI